ncbi:hypothetical protein [Dinoroseobacter sp. S124A]|uniref:hypothetical protein n=1 Tax=Dinoroseobacter sp. S124A TaxID=3415128 RepID=UPI003C7D38A8
MKLTDAQAFCLAYLAEHGDSTWVTLRDAGGDDFHKLVVEGAMVALAGYKLVGSIKTDNGFHFRITDTGRQALRDHREGMSAWRF